MCVNSMFSGRATLAGWSAVTGGANGYSACCTDPTAQTNAWLRAGEISVKTLLDIRSRQFKAAHSHLVRGELLDEKCPPPNENDALDRDAKNRNEIDFEQAKQAKAISQAHFTSRRKTSPAKLQLDRRSARDEKIKLRRQPTTKLEQESDSPVQI